MPNSAQSPLRGRASPASYRDATTLQDIGAAQVIVGRQRLTARRRLFTWVYTLPPSEIAAYRMAVACGAIGTAQRRDGDVMLLLAWRNPLADKRGAAK